MPNNNNTTTATTPPNPKGNKLPKGLTMAQPPCGKTIVYGSPMYRVNNTGTKYGGNLLATLNTAAYTAVVAIVNALVVTKSTTWVLTYSKVLYRTYNPRGRVLTVLALHVTNHAVQLHVPKKWGSYLQVKGTTTFTATHSSYINLVGLTPAQLKLAVGCINSVCKSIQGN